MMEHKELYVHMTNPVVVSVSARETDWLWGHHQFPSMWTGADNNQYLWVSKGQDAYAHVGLQNPPCYYKSQDIGKTWSVIDEAQVPMDPNIITFSDGEQIIIGKMETQYYEKPDCNLAGYNLTEYNIKPIAERETINYGYGKISFYNYRDLPDDLKSFTLYSKAPGCDAFCKEHGRLVCEDFVFGMVTAGRLSLNQPFETKPHIYKKLLPVNTLLSQANGGSISNATQHSLTQSYVIDQNDYLYAMLGQYELIPNGYFISIHCIRSTDRGRTWHLVSKIVDQKIVKWGFAITECEMIMTDSGRLLCAFRSDLCMLGSHTDTDYETYVCWSDDLGKSWTTPIAAAPSSVTPHLVKLGNGIIALVHGRPGVHVCFSTDEGESWHNSTRVIGLTTKEVIELSDSLNIPYQDYVYSLSTRTKTCSNTTVTSVKKNSFLLAYSDFRHTGVDEKMHKAIKIVKITAEVNAR